MHSRYALSQTHCFDLSMVGHSEILLSKCAQFREQGEFIDVYLKVAKVIGGVRLGLVDIKEVIRELNTEEMQRVPEIHLLLHESLLHTCMPSVSSKFAVEKSKLRSTSQVCEAFIIQLFECN